ncbi:hypothetical protein [Parasphingorhabdus pacifica]
MWPTEDQTDELGWWIPCEHPHGPQQNITVLVVGDRVAVVLPPGDTLIFDPTEATELANALDRGAIAPPS